MADEVLERINENDDVCSVIERIELAQSLEDLEEMAQIAMRLGHSGLVDNVFSKANQILLAKAGAQRSEIYRFGKAFCRNDHPEMFSILSDRGIRPLTPTRDLLYKTLVNSVVPMVQGTNSHRGVTIDDPSTSVGDLYQRLYGKDYENKSFDRAEINEILGISNTNGEASSVRYSELCDEEKTAAHFIILNEKLKKATESELKETAA